MTTEKQQNQTNKQKMVFVKANGAYRTAFSIHIQRYTTTSAIQKQTVSDGWCGARVKKKMLYTRNGFLSVIKKN